MITGIAIAIGVPHYILAITETSVVNIVSYVGLTEVNGSEIYGPSTSCTHTGVNNWSYVYPSIKIAINFKLEVGSIVGVTRF